MKRTFILSLLIVLFNVNFIVSQGTKKIDGLEITYLKSKKASKTFNARAGTVVRGKEVKRVMVRCKLKSTNKLIDINAFSLVDEKNKIRYRLSDINAYYAFGGPRVRTLLKEQPLDKKGNPKDIHGLEYSPDVSDSFLKFPFKGYYISESKYPFSSGQRIVPYFDKIKAKRPFTTDMYFVLSEHHLKSGKHGLYYGSTKIISLTF